MNSFEFIRKFNWIYQQIHLKYLQILWKYHSFLLFGFLEKIVNEFTMEVIELNLRLISFFNSFFCFFWVFSHFAKLWIKFLKSKLLSWISNSFCHSRNEFTDEFIDLNLIFFCDVWTDRRKNEPRRGLIESPIFLIARLKIAP